MANARILFSTNQLPGSIMIRLATWSQFSHVDMIVGDGSRLIGALPFGAGVSEYDLQHRLTHARKTAVYEANFPQELVEREIRKQLGKPYDYVGVVGVGFHRDWSKDSKWFCSEIIAASFAQAGYPLVNPELRLNRVTPETLLRSPLLKHVPLQS
jgi:uncharacterized protein YycO